MSETLGIETRSRSRSKTPGLLSQENGDSIEKKGSKKVPTISLIEEEEDAVESQPSQRPKRQRRSAKNAQSDTSNDNTSETVVSNSKQSKTTITTTTTTVLTTQKNINGSEEKNDEESTKTTVVLNEAQEVSESQSIFNNIFNAIKTSTPILSSKRTKRATQESRSLQDVDYNLHPAYKEYKDAGEYWNKFPKTDYTYSELSPHRRELGAGIVAMPNMSRRSLDKYQIRVEDMIKQNPTEESFIRRKFLSNMSYQKKAVDLQYDSADEVDVSVLHQKLSYRRYSQKNVFYRFYLFIVGVFSSTYSNVKQKIYRTNQRPSYTPIKRHNQQGILRGIYSSSQKFFLLCISKVYLIISTILCLDTWILHTRSENVQENRKRKRFLLGLLFLLPLLLLGGTYIYLDPPKNISFPKLSLPQLPNISFPKIVFPSIPKISFDFKWSEISWPTWLTFPQFTWPSFDFSFPSISLAAISFNWPELSFPSWPIWLTLPELSWPSYDFSLPSWFRLPTFSFYLPDISFSWPEISFAWLKWPEFSLPSWFAFPEISLPAFSFDFLNPAISYIADIFVSLKVSSIDLLDKIQSATTGLLNEIQIVWNENFNVK